MYVSGGGSIGPSVSSPAVVPVLADASPVAVLENPPSVSPLELEGSVSRPSPVEPSVPSEPAVELPPVKLSPVELSPVELSPEEEVSGGSPVEVLDSSEVVDSVPLVGPWVLEEPDVDTNMEVVDVGVPSVPVEPLSDSSSLALESSEHATIAKANVQIVTDSRFR